jgi:CDP-diacylglycerol--serine O-phosphatidyltransferase
MNLLGIMRQERYRKRLTPLPFFFTFANAALGFTAVIQALEGNHITAVYCILAAAFMDVFDGRLARALGTTSMLGVELDSLVDGISFCLAPAVLFYTAYPSSMDALPFTILITYICAGLYRLAKFNAHAIGSSKSYFSGLPTPMAAFCLISFVLHQEWILAHGTSQFTKYGLFLIIGIVTLLMVSSIPFKKHSALSPCEITMLICVSSFAITLAHTYEYPWLLILSICYIVVSLGKYSYEMCRKL